MVGGVAVGGVVVVVVFWLCVRACACLRASLGVSVFVRARACVCMCVQVSERACIDALCGIVRVGVHAGWCTCACAYACFRFLMLRRKRKNQIQRPGLPRVLCSTLRRTSSRTTDVLALALAFAVPLRNVAVCLGFCCVIFRDSDQRAVLPIVAAAFASAAACMLACMCVCVSCPASVFFKGRFCGKRTTLT